MTMQEANKDDLTGEVYISDEYLLEAEQTHFNLRTDSETALLTDAAIETGIDTIYALQKEQRPNPVQQKAIDTYKSATNALGGANSSDDTVVKVSMEAIADAATITTIQKKLLKDLLKYSTDSVGTTIKSTKGAYDHYAKEATRLITDLSALKRNLKDNLDQIPVKDYFEYGAYSRFFQAAGKPLEDFESFCAILSTLKSSLQFAQHSGTPLAESTSRQCLKALNQMQVAKTRFDKDEYEHLVDRIRDDTLDVWKNAIADMPSLYSKEYPATVPSGIGSNGKTRGAISSLFDNNMLCWIAPEEYASVKPNTTQRVDFFGAVVIRDPSLDKKSDKPLKAKGMDIPDNKSLIRALDDAIEMLSAVQRYSESTGRLDDLGSELKSALKALNALTETEDSTIALKDYVPLALASVQAHIQPHIRLIWLAIRSSIMLAAIAETSTLTDLEKGKYAVVAKKTTDKVIVKLDIDHEPEQAAAKEMGYFTSVLLKLRKS